MRFTGTIRCVVAGMLLAATGTIAAPAARAQSSQTVSGYIVTLDDTAADVAAIADDQLGELGVTARPEHVFESALDGYTADLTPAQAQVLAGMSGVRSVEADPRIWLTDTQPNPPWGVDRVDQADLPLSNSYTWTATGAGVTAYVVDSGARMSHADFGGRATTGIDVMDGGEADDCLGHGTHVSSTIGGATHGVAKQVSLVQVRVFACSSTGNGSDLIEGIDWIIEDHQPGEPAVANMSLAFFADTAIDDAVQSLIDDGVTVAVAAGNGAFGLFPLNACDFSPARLPGAITVGATDVNDAMANFSNRGSCVDILAPGVDVPGASFETDDGAVNMSGTSMATPHVVGAATKLLQLTPGATPAQVTDTLKQQATPDTITGTGPCWAGIFCLFQPTPNLFLRTNT